MWKNLLLLGLIMLVLDAFYLFILKNLTLPMIYRIQKTELKTRLISVLVCYLLYF